nr:hypothetical protein [Angustibacter aerolatus]
MRFSLMPHDVAKQARPAHLADQRAHRRGERLRRGRLRGAPQLQPRGGAGGLARGVRRACFARSTPCSAPRRRPRRPARSSS